MGEFVKNTMDRNLDAEVDEIACYMKKMEENGELYNLENNSHSLSFVDALFIILDPRTRASLRVNINDIKNPELSKMTEEKQELYAEALRIVKNKFKSGLLTSPKPRSSHFHIKTLKF